MPKRIIIPLFAGLALLTTTPALAQDLPNLEKLAGFIRWGGVAIAIPVIIGTIVVKRLIQGISARLGVRFANRRLTIQKVESFATFVLYIAAAAVVIGLSFRLDPTAMAVIGGALAFAIGFAMRDLVAAFIAGITIMFDRPFQVGDRVEYGGQYGDIIKIGLRSIRMNTLDHNIVTIPNNKILTDVTSCGNYGALEMQVPIDFYVGIDQDIRRAIKLIEEVVITSRFVYLDMPVPILAKQVILQDYVAMHIKARPYVLDTKYEKPFETDVHLRVWELFNEHGILPPAVLHRQMGDLGRADRRTAVRAIS